GYDEDTTYINSKDLYISIPDSVLTFTPTEGITNYIKRIQIKNLSTDTLHITRWHKDSKHFDLQIDKQILAPNETAYLTLSFTRQAFIYAPTLNIRLETNTKTTGKSINLRCVLKY
ncbi:MAG TPA: hypothetical protein PKX15_00815, partial [Bacteroidales bacterium]|nr:hypothetical protein [Bacteroidales bacterium]